MNISKIITKEDFINFCKTRKGSCKRCILFKNEICDTGERYSTFKEWQDNVFNRLIKTIRREKLAKLLSND